MDLFYDILLWLHIVAFVAGGANTVAMPLIESRLHTAIPETRAVLFAMAGVLARIGRAAMIVLLITGPVLLVMRYGGVSGASVWFWLKMGLIVVMLVSIVVGGISFKRAQNGDAGALDTASTAGKITAVAFLGVLLSAVFAFN